MVNNKSTSGLRVLVTNDDCIHSSGIKILERIANSLTPDVWVVAPEVEQSGKGGSVTFDSPLRLNAISPRKFSVNGTPSDCVFMAVGEILKTRKPDLILSGINHGSNVSDYIGLSGTVGAAFAAASQGINAIAISQDCVNNKKLQKFPLVEHFLPQMIKKLISFQWPNSVCMNINFPNASLNEIIGIKVATQGYINVKWDVTKKDDPSGNPYYWLHADCEDISDDQTADVTLLSQKKYITVTALKNRHEYAGCNSKLEELFLSNV